MDPANETLAHLQAAARELIAAARSTLDVLDGVVADPHALAPLVETASEVGRLAAETARAYLTRRAEGLRADPPAPQPEGPGDGRPDGPGAASGRVERIRVS